MRLMHAATLAVALAAATGAQATVSGSLGGEYGTFATLSGTGVVPNSGGTLSGATSATIVGGTVFAADQTFADDVVPGENFLAAGPTAGQPSVLTFATPVNYISFLWGSPDTYNTLTVFSNGGTTSQTFTTASMLFPVQNGDQSFNQAVQFVATAGQITGLKFESTINAFEVGRFTVTPVPEPGTYALMLAGLGVMGYVARRRRG